MTDPKSTQNQNDPGTDYMPSEAEVKAGGRAVEQHPFVTLVVRDGEWVATCDGCDAVLDGGPDMDVACREHARHLARAVLVAAHAAAPGEGHLPDWWACPGDCDCVGRLCRPVAPAPCEYVVDTIPAAAVREVLSDVPPCDKYTDDDAVSCGWKSAVASIRALLPEGDA
jgi:hypothetical protein